LYASLSQQSTQLNSCTVTYKCTAKQLYCKVQPHSWTVLFWTEQLYCTEQLYWTAVLYCTAVVNSCTELYNCTKLFSCKVPCRTAILYCTAEQYCTAGMSQHIEQMYCSCLAVTHSTAVKVFCTAHLYFYTITAQLYSCTVVLLYSGTVVQVYSCTVVYSNTAHRCIGQGNWATEASKIRHSYNINLIDSGISRYKKLEI